MTLTGRRNLYQSTASTAASEKISFKYQEFGQFITNEIGLGIVEKFNVSLEFWLVGERG